MLAWTFPGQGVLLSGARLAERRASPIAHRKIGARLVVSSMAAKAHCKGNILTPAICPGASCATCMSIANIGHHRVLPNTDDWVTV
jgi:hypothetical protein